MKLLLDRKYKMSTYTIGKLYIDDEYFCDTLEDKDRGLVSTDSLSKIKSLKVSGNTAIPTGIYDITLDVKSNKYSNFSKYVWAKDSGGYIPRLLDVPGFDGILIHVGNTASDTSGCILVGENKVKGQVINSRVTWLSLYDILKNSWNLSKDINIEIKN